MEPASLLLVAEGNKSTTALSPDASAQISPQYGHGVEEADLLDR